MRFPKVSVIIPTFNRADLLPQAIDSILYQSYTDFELIVVDDGSTDASQEILSGYRGKLRYLFQSNTGVSAARNLGIKKARGRYISFLDSDDLWLRDKLREQIGLMKSDPGIRVSYTDEIWMRGGKRVNQGKRHRKYSGWILKELLPICLISPSSVMMERGVFEEVGLFDEGFPVCEDYDLWLRISSRMPIHLIEKPLIIKRGGRADQLSQIYWGQDRFRIKALLKLLSQDGMGEKEEILAILERKCRIYGGGCIKRGRFEEGEFYLNLPKAMRKRL